MAPRILIAEDDPAVRSLLLHTIGLDGYDAKAVSGGKEAIEAVRTFCPDLVILDVMMPGADGLSVLREFRADTRTSELPVILLTARADDGATWAGWRAGCNSYISKPFDPAHLLATVEQLVREARGRSA